MDECSYHRRAAEPTTLHPVGGEGADQLRCAGETSGGYDAGKGGTGDGDSDGGAGAAGGGAARDAQQLEALLDDLRHANRLTARAVLAAGELAGAGVAERCCGDTLEGVLATACRLTGSDRKTLIAAGEVLAHMPVVAGLFRDGALSWGEVRRITAEARHFDRRERANLDDLVRDGLARRGLAGWSPDELLGAVRAAARRVRALAEAEQAEADGVAESYVAVQRDLDGGAVAHARLDPLTAATVVGALDAAAATPAGDDHSDNAVPASPRSRQYAQALDQICGEWAAGHAEAEAEAEVDADADDAGAGDGERAHRATTGKRGHPDGSRRRPATARRPRPLIRVLVRASEATATDGGALDLPVRVTMPRLTAAAVDALACSATVQAVLADGHRPLATTDHLTADDIPDKIRAAVEARDQGLPLARMHRSPRPQRDPPSPAPRRGGDHHPENLVVLCRNHHLRAHAHDWTLRLDGDTGELSAHRAGLRRWRTHPRNTRLPHTNHQGDRDPPGPDPPPTDAEGNSLPF